MTVPAVFFRDLIAALDAPVKPKTALRKAVKTLRTTVARDGAIPLRAPRSTQARSAEQRSRRSIRKTGRATRCRCTSVGSQRIPASLLFVRKISDVEASFGRDCTPGSREPMTDSLGVAGECGMARVARTGTTLSPRCGVNVLDASGGSGVCARPATTTRDSTTRH